MNVYVDFLIAGVALILFYAWPFLFSIFLWFRVKDGLQSYKYYFIFTIVGGYIAYLLALLVAVYVDIKIEPIHIECIRLEQEGRLCDNQTLERLDFYTEWGYLIHILITMLASSVIITYLSCRYVKKHNN